MKLLRFLWLFLSPAWMRTKSGWLRAPGSVEEYVPGRTLVLSGLFFPRCCYSARVGCVLHACACCHLRCAPTDHLASYSADVETHQCSGAHGLATVHTSVDEVPMSDRRDSLITMRKLAQKHWPALVPLLEQEHLRESHEEQLRLIRREAALRKNFLIAQRRQELGLPDLPKQ